MIIVLRIAAELFISYFATKLIFPHMALLNIWQISGAFTGIVELLIAWRNLRVSRQEQIPSSYRYLEKKPERSTVTVEGKTYVDRDAPARYQL